MPIRKELRHLYRGPAWHEARARIRERAGDRCERCSARNGEKATRYGQDGRKVIVIQCGAAHINHDDLERFYADDNLAWLCRGCHLRFDMQKHKDTRSARKDAARPLLQELSA